MIKIVNLSGNLTLLSVIEILFVQQDYRTINFLTERLHHELSNKMMEISSNSMIPSSHFIVGEINTGRSSGEEPILNVVILDHLNNVTIVELVRENIFPDDVTVILPTENHGIPIEIWMNLSTKVILLTPNLTMFYNTFEEVPSSTINLSPFNPILSRKLIENVFSKGNFPRNQTNFRVFFQFSPPRSSVGTFGQDFILIGPDGSVAETIVKWLKVDAIFYTDIAMSYPDYKNWSDNAVLSSRMHYQSFYSKVRTKNVLTIFNKSVTESMDLHLSQYSVYGDSTKLKTESLYPHEKDCLVVMVPKQSKLDHFLQKITRDPDIQSICIALILFAIVRIIIQRTPLKQWISIFIKSLGIFLNQDKIRNENNVELAWDMNLRGFSVLATIALSVIIYQNLMSKEYSEIDTVDDLIVSNLTIFVPDFLQNDASFWSNLKPVLHQKITFKGINDINVDMVEKRKFDSAYVFTDGAAEYMDMLLYSFISSAKSYKRTVRIMPEKLYCRLSSYRISKMSPLKKYVNDFIRRFVENGLYDKHLEWIRRLNSDIFQVNKYKTMSTDPVVLDIDLMFGIIALYLAGVTISVLIFILELKI